MDRLSKQPHFSLELQLEVAHGLKTQAPLYRLRFIHLEYQDKEPGRGQEIVRVLFLYSNLAQEFTKKCPLECVSDTRASAEVTWYTATGSASEQILTENKFTKSLFKASWTVPWPVIQSSQALYMYSDISSHSYDIRVVRACHISFHKPSGS